MHFEDTESELNTILHNLSTEAQDVLNVFLENILKDAYKHAKTKTIHESDVVHALKRQLQLSQSITNFKNNKNYNENNFKKNNNNKLCHDDLNTCLSLGLVSKKMKKVYTKMNLMKSVNKIEKLNGEGTQGDIYKLTSTLSDNVSLITLLKTIKPKHNNNERYPDNMMYEYFIGKTLNTFVRTPNIVLTMNLWKYTSSDKYENFREAENPLVVLNDTFEKLTDEINAIKVENSCVRPEIHALQLLYVPHSITLYDLLKNKEHFLHDRFVQYYFTSTLFQIYAFLRIHQKVFTHHDLHDANVLLTFIPGQFFRFKYHDTSHGTVQFDSLFLVKIIDYGRSYCHTITPQLLKLLCSIKQCNPDCGFEKGYFVINFKRNISDDLYLLKTIFKFFKNEITNNVLKEYLMYYLYIGDAELIQNGYPDTINNVEDAYRCLLEIVRTTNVREPNLSEVLKGTFQINTAVANTFKDAQNDQMKFTFSLNDELKKT